MFIPIRYNIRNGGLNMTAYTEIDQRYLNEFCYRFNRRFKESEIFDHILTASLSTHTLTFAELTQ